MRIDKTLKLSLNMLLHSKLRSWLTVLGIVIGVSAVVAIISIGEGLQQNVQSQISGLGQDILTISAGSSRAFGGGEFGGGARSSVKNPEPLSTKDIQALKLVPGVSAINGIVSGRTNVNYNSEKSTLSIQGVDTSVFSEFVTTGLAQGRYFSPGESRAAVIGNGAANSIFTNPIQVGSTLSINGTLFRIAGILSSSSGFGSSDNVIYMSEKDARDILKSNLDLASNQYSSIQVKVSDVNFINDTTNAVDAALANERHSIGNNKDYSVTSPLALQQRFTQLTSSITLFLGLIAAVSLLVGGIGVANTMFTAVLERTRDIGVMKAVGAKNRDILFIFLFNSGMLGLVGGIIGVIFGVIISTLLPLIGISIGLGGGGGLHTAVSFNLLFFSLLFSLLIGMVSGAVPAYRASKLKPVEALRYE